MVFVPLAIPQVADACGGNKAKQVKKHTKEKDKVAVKKTKASQKAEGDKS